jgi:prevent-host-death family protein
MYTILNIMYTLLMKSFPLSDARKDLPTLVDRTEKEPILITRHGEEAAVLISPSLYETMLEAMEELEDIAAYDGAKARKEDSQAWVDVRKELGLA